MIKSTIISAILMTLVLTLFTGVFFPVLVWALSQALFPYQANGSLVARNGIIIGSELIGQGFSSPKYFHTRPSAAGGGYDPLSSSGTNLGPTSKKLFSGIENDIATPDVDESYAGVEALTKDYRAENGLAENSPIPVDAVTRSASGLDPHISIMNARMQAARVARERGVNKDEVEALIEKYGDNRFLGIYGEPRINVLQLNLALDDLQREGQS